MQATVVLAAVAYTLSPAVRHGCVAGPRRHAVPLVIAPMDKFQWITVGAVILFCIPTIIFRNVEFLKWKAPIVNWIFAAIFFSSTYFSKKPAIAHMMDHAINAPEEVWFKLNKLWIAYFVLLGGINLFVAFSLSEALWIKFKVFGNLTLTFLFVFGQMPILSKYLPQE